MPTTNLPRTQSFGHLNISNVVQIPNPPVKGNDRFEKDTARLPYITSPERCLAASRLQTHLFY